MEQKPSLSKFLGGLAVLTILLIRVSALRIFILALNDKDISEVIKGHFNNDDLDIQYYISYWYLAMAYSFKDDTLNTKEYLIKAQDLLKACGIEGRSIQWWCEEALP